MQKIVPHLWFDTEAAEAAEFYMSLFENSRLLIKNILKDTPSGDAEILSIQLAGQDFMLISAGPYFKFTPAVSFLVSCRTPEEVEAFWGKMIEGGAALMPLDTYDFSARYGWLMDKYGLSWQFMCTGEAPITQKIKPTLMFVGDQCGNAESAAEFYVSLFDNSEIGGIMRYEEGWPPNKPGTIQHMQFTLNGFQIAAMDSAYEHDFTFNEAVSLVVHCDTQEEIDRFWAALSAVPEAEQCGWLKDKFGLSWQIVPSIMNDLMATEDTEQLSRVTQAFLKMKKFNIQALIEATKV